MKTFQDMSTDQGQPMILMSEIIEILEGLDEEGVQYQEDGSVILGDLDEGYGRCRLW